MIIVLDFDGTYTADPQMWDQIIPIMKAQGHKVICATMRHEAIEGDEVKAALGHQVDQIIFTGRKAKFNIVRTALISQDLPLVEVTRSLIWIDDQPHYVIEDA